jgi:hypothetical protein
MVSPYGHSLALHIFEQLKQPKTAWLKAPIQGFWALLPKIASVI